MARHSYVPNGCDQTSFHGSTTLRKIIIVNSQDSPTCSYACIDRPKLSFCQAARLKWK